MKNAMYAALVAAALLVLVPTASALELTQRQVQIDKDLSMNAAHKVARKLFKLNSAGNEPIFLIISTRSGFAPAAMVVADAIGAIESPVHAVVQPEAFGVGAIIAIFAINDTRSKMHRCCFPSWNTPQQKMKMPLHCRKQPRTPTSHEYGKRPPSALILIPTNC